MSLLDEVRSQELALRPRGRVEERTIGGTPWLPFVPFGQGGPVHPTKYHIGQEHALRLAPLYGAIDLLANAVASLPLKIYLTQPDGTKQLWTGPSMFDDPDPNPLTTYFEWMFGGMVSLLVHGNALGYITSRDGFGYPQQIVWLPPERCDILDDYSPDFASPTNSRYFYEGRLLDKADLFHVRGLVMAGHTAGLSPLNAFKILIEGGLDRQDYAKQFFANGGFPLGVFKNMELEVDSDQSTEIRGRLTETLRKRQPLVIGRDWDYTAIVVPPEQAQFVQTTHLDATQIAAIYHVPPERIGGTRGDSMTYSNQEQGTNDMISWSLRPWVRRWENAFFRILPQRRYVKFDVDDLVRVDQAQRYANHKVARDAGWLTNNEIRYEEDRAPLAKGIGEEPLPNDVLVAMARGSKVIPKSFENLVIESPGEKPAVPPGAVPVAAGGKPALSIVPPGGTPPVDDQQAQGARYSLEEIATRCFGPVGVKQEYLDLVTASARDGGYAVTSVRSEQFSKEQADWIAADSLRRPRPVERFELNGHSVKAAG